MVVIEANVRLSSLVEIMRIRTVVGNGVMLIITARIGTGPSTDRHIVDRRLQHWPLNDLDVLGRLYRRKDLSSGWIWGYEAEYGDNSQYACEQPLRIHRFYEPRKDRPSLSP